MAKLHKLTGTPQPQIPPLAWQRDTQGRHGVIGMVFLYMALLFFTYHSIPCYDFIEKIKEDDSLFFPYGALVLLNFFSIFFGSMFLAAGLYFLNRNHNLKESERRMTRFGFPAGAVVFVLSLFIVYIYLTAMEYFNKATWTWEFDPDTRLKMFIRGLEYIYIYGVLDILLFFVLVLSIFVVLWRILSSRRYFRMALAASLIISMIVLLAGAASVRYSIDEIIDSSERMIGSGETNEEVDMLMMDSVNRTQRLLYDFKVLDIFTWASLLCIWTGLVGAHMELNSRRPEWPICPVCSSPLYYYKNNGAYYCARCGTIIRL